MHYEHLNKVFRKIRESGLKLNKDKSLIGVNPLYFSNML